MSTATAPQESGNLPSGESITLPPSVHLTELSFSDGSHIALEKGDVVVIVGPNNAGKSATLRAIRHKLENENHASPVLSGLNFKRNGSPSGLKSWLLDWAFGSENLPQSDYIEVFGVGLSLHSAQASWPSAPSLGLMTRWFCHMLSADERLQISNPAGMISLTRGSPSHPIHFLVRDDELELRLSAEFKAAFGVDLVVHRNDGASFPLHVGERPQPNAGEDRVSISYVRRLEQLPALQAQGDGMRSFAGVLLAASVGKESILLVDEPEAFLHPPQARRLGATLVRTRKDGRQLFIATHSTDILRGVLDSEDARLKVLRLRREGDKNFARVLSNDRINELWSDPLLRYSNIFDGLFHEGVVVCESDGDCRFYGAVLDALHADGSRAPDLMFTHCGGKARLAMVIKALRELEVPVAAVADFDVLSNEKPLRDIVEALGLDWATTVASDWGLVKSSIDNKKPDLSTEEVKKEIGEILASITEDKLTKKAKSDIQNVLKMSSAWAHAKQVGKSFVPSGDPTKACERLLETLRNAGLHVVEVGELENFVKSEGGHGPKWVNAVLTRALATDEDLEDARRFVGRIEVQLSGKPKSPKQ